MAGTLNPMPLQPGKAQRHPLGCCCTLAKGLAAPCKLLVVAQPHPPWLPLCLSCASCCAAADSPSLFLSCSFSPSLCSSSGLFWGIPLHRELAQAPPERSPPSGPWTLPLSLCTLSPPCNPPEQPWQKDRPDSACLSFSLSMSSCPGSAGCALQGWPVLGGVWSPAVPLHLVWG